MLLGQDPKNFSPALPFPRDLIHVLQNTYLLHTVICKLEPMWKLGVLTTKFEFLVAFDKSDLETLHRLLFPIFHTTHHSRKFP